MYQKEYEDEDKLIIAGDWHIERLKTMRELAKLPFITEDAEDV